MLSNFKIYHSSLLYYKLRVLSCRFLPRFCHGRIEVLFAASSLFYWINSVHSQTKQAWVRLICEGIMIIRSDAVKSETFYNFRPGAVFLLYHSISYSFTQLILHRSVIVSHCSSIISAPYCKTSDNLLFTYRQWWKWVLKLGKL